MCRFTRLVAGLALGALCAISACAVVPQSQREHLTDPTMQPSVDPLEERALRKLHDSREGASGGGGQAAGGGCGCSN